ncbi:MAG: carbonic anhydrase [Hyphomicrobiales bacterium]|nr:carbonic anhydrase [Hyphomicrobiales bacterium]
MSTTETRAASPLLPDRLVDGYRAFLDGRFPNERRRFEILAEKGQKPSIMLIGCCDSRCAPEVIFDAAPGEIFVLRNVAALVPPYKPNDDYHSTSAALEFGVMGLRVEHIVVMGHESCGGVKAYADNEADPYLRPLSPGDFIGQWIKLIQPAAQRLGPAPTKPDAAYVEKLAFQSVMQSIANLRTFPCIRTLEEKGRLTIHGAYFGVADGRLLALDEARGSFEAIAEDSWRTAFAAPRF